jgi:NAD(P)-dependent dehydrogenase (short-subunit alcohol dehydrogenase family)
VFSREALAQAGHVDVVVNNAAVFFPTPLATLTVEMWQTMIRTNLTAPFVLALHFGRVMRAQGQGSIIQIGDWTGLRPARGYLPYCVSKGGLVALTQALAKALAPQVQVNSVVLGPILPPDHYDAAALRAIQEQTPLRRVGQVEDVVRVVRFVVNRGAFVTGATYVVDGGWLVSAAGGTETAV